MFAQSRFDVFTSKKFTICGLSQISRTYTTITSYNMHTFLIYIYIYTCIIIHAFYLYNLQLYILYIFSGFFYYGTRRYGVPAPFFQSKEKKLFVMYIIDK